MGFAKLRLLAVTSVSLSLTVFACTPAMAQRNCAPRDVVLERLASSYGETRRSVGLGTNNSMVEVFASDKSGSWTITVTAPTGLTCLVASGQAFEMLDDALPLAGDDT